MDTASEKVKLCYLCGKNPANTRDHIPPKSIFGKPRPSDLITVPCCFSCNNTASKDDEKFKVYLGMHVAKKGGDAEKLFKENVIATTNKNAKLRAGVLKNTQPVFLQTNTGIIYEKAFALVWDNDVHDKTVERMVRGLFYYHYNGIIGDRAHIKTYWFNESPKGLDVDLDFNSIANGKFKYLYRKADDCEFDSIWIFSFYGGHFAGGVVYTDSNDFIT